MHDICDVYYLKYSGEKKVPKTGLIHQVMYIQLSGEDRKMCYYSTDTSMMMLMFSRYLGVMNSTVITSETQMFGYGIYTSPDVYTAKWKKSLFYCH